MATEASSGNLVYVDDAGPGIRRVRRGKGFSYIDPEGRPLRDASQIARIRKLAIPPAYTSVWICPLPDGHLQATGRDARGRKQYRYHPAWSQQRDERKFERLAAFGLALPAIRARVARDLASDDSGQPKRIVVLATLVRLLDTTLMRVGSDQYARENGSYGLTTLQDRHAEVRKGVLRLSFRGKSGVKHDVTLDDPRLARIVRRCQELPGQELFQFEDGDGEIRSVGSSDVNEYLAEAAGERFTAKDFRTWHGTVLALEWTRRACLAIGEEPGGDDGDARRCDPPPAMKAPTGYTMKAMLAEVARELGNTPAVCRKAYIHPAVLELGTALTRSDASGPDAELWKRLGGADRPRGLHAAEYRLLDFLEGHRRRAASDATAVPGQPDAAPLRRPRRERRRSSRR